MTDAAHERARDAERELREAMEEKEPAVEEMEERSDRLESQIEETEREWEGKREDRSIPGAQPDLGEVETERQDIGGKPAGES